MLLNRRMADDWLSRQLDTADGASPPPEPAATVAAAVQAGPSARDDHAAPSHRANLLGNAAGSVEPATRAPRPLSRTDPERPPDTSSSGGPARHPGSRASSTASSEPEPECSLPLPSDDDGVSAGWLEQSISASSAAASASRSRSRSAQASPDQAEAEADARLAHDRARLRNGWERLTHEKEKLATQRRDFEEVAAVRLAMGTPSPYAALKAGRPASAGASRRTKLARPGSAPSARPRSTERRSGGHRTARRRNEAAAQAAADAAYTARLRVAAASTPGARPASASRSQRQSAPITTKQDVGDGWQLVLTSSNLSDLLIPTNRIAVSYWHEGEQRNTAEPPPHITGKLRQLLAPDRSGCVSATTIQRLVEKSAAKTASAVAAGIDPTAQSLTPVAPAAKRKRKKAATRKKRKPEPLDVKMKKRAERVSRAEEERSKEEWLKSRPKDYLAGLSASSSRGSSRRSPQRGRRPGVTAAVA